MIKSQYALRRACATEVVSQMQAFAQPHPHPAPWTSALGQKRRRKKLVRNRLDVIITGRGRLSMVPFTYIAIRQFTCRGHGSVVAEAMQLHLFWGHSMNKRDFSFFLEIEDVTFEDSHYGSRHRRRSVSEAVSSTLILGRADATKASANTLTA
jgi:hypothetical protein